MGRAASALQTVKEKTIKKFIKILLFQKIYVHLHKIIGESLNYCDNGDKIEADIGNYAAGCYIIQHLVDI